jgi:hypothetical protein
MIREKMKRIIIITLSLVFMLIACVSCGKNPKSRIIGTWNLFEVTKDRYTEKPDIKVQWVFERGGRGTQPLFLTENVPIKISWEIDRDNQLRIFRDRQAVRDGIANYLLIEYHWTEDEINIEEIEYFLEDMPSEYQFSIVDITKSSLVVFEPLWERRMIFIKEGSQPVINTDPNANPPRAGAVNGLMDELRDYIPQDAKVQVGDISTSDKSLQNHIQNEITTYFKGRNLRIVKSKGDFRVTGRIEGQGSSRRLHLQLINTRSGNVVDTVSARI